MGSWKSRLNSGELLLFSSHEPEVAEHIQGVVLVISKSEKRALIERSKQAS
ncbi:hypothetical protein DPMN_088768 [Dreissena polymorpha]|uniref:Uncharacterized protein n=1 Tax=Dreissena polymorpha TaxID=45954 RepID=A0A9D4QXK2_DREPO|nr:hypothetical protein DPMN_088768 [Dreissena polymorpha]